MTKMELAIAKLNALPEDRRAFLVDVIIDLADRRRYVLTDEQLADVDLSIKEADEGKFVSEAELAALWKKFGL